MFTQVFRRFPGLRLLLAPVLLIACDPGLSQVSRDSNAVLVPSPEPYTAHSAPAVHSEGNSAPHPPDYRVVVLKGGSMIRGSILSYNPLTVRTADSSVLTLNMHDVISISRDRDAVASRSASSSATPGTGAAPPIFSTVARRGESWSLSAGLTVPVGSFGSTDGENAGFANSGFAFGFEWNTGSENVRFTMGGLLSFNGSDIASTVGGYGFQSESGTWTTFWGMSGGRFSAPLGPSVRFRGDVQIGALLGISPEIKLSAQMPGPYPGQVRTVSVTQKPSTGVGFAYGLGFGITLSQFDLGFRYLSGTPEYEFKAEGSTGISATGKYKQPTSLLSLTAGINL